MVPKAGIMVRLGLGCLGFMHGIANWVVVINCGNDQCLIHKVAASHLLHRKNFDRLLHCQMVKKQRAQPRFELYDR